jgi:hypothetical protein
MPNMTLKLIKFFGLTTKVAALTATVNSGASRRVGDGTAFVQISSAHQRGGADTTLALRQPNGTAMAVCQPADTTTFGALINYGGNVATTLQRLIKMIDNFSTTF